MALMLQDRDRRHIRRFLRAPHVGTFAACGCGVWGRIRIPSGKSVVARSYAELARFVSSLRLTKRESVFSISIYSLVRLHSAGVCITRCWLPKALDGFVRLRSVVLSDLTCAARDGLFDASPDAFFPMLSTW
ncbi:hypothetical protein D9611_013702 [Ephemerocybe angulata]|uniref:Uncharacterized protein n=1 Tax=Ephemerocybe angulata TaxID=980116 RepID=A0A8H5F099_9AGAR|nr:hypothetical protein D9611_013702 [Tulosesus angulatus]